MEEVPDQLWNTLLGLQKKRDTPPHPQPNDRTPKLEQRQLFKIGEPQLSLTFSAVGG